MMTTAMRTPFLSLPTPDWPRGHAVPALKAEVTEALTLTRPDGTPTTAWWRWAALGPDVAKPKNPATPNQHVVGLGIAALVEGTVKWRAAIERWYAWQEAALMGVTFRKAEALGGDYQQLYVLGSCLIEMAARRDGIDEIAGRAHLDLRRHAAINTLLRVPGSSPPRSLSFGCRTAIPDETVPQALACVLARWPLTEWGEHGGQSLKRQLDRPGRLTGVDVFRRAWASGLIGAMACAPTIGHVVDEVGETDLRLPWPMRWQAMGAEPTHYAAAFAGSFPAGGEHKGGVLQEITSGILPRPAERVAWDLTVGPDGLTVVRRADGIGGAPAPPPRPEPPQRDPEDPAGEPGAIAELARAACDIADHGNRRDRLQRLQAACGAPEVRALLEAR